MSDAQVTLIGNLTRDPELRFTAGGTAVASFGLAVNRRWMQNGEWQEKVSFFNATAWGELGEHMSSSLVKGSRVLLTGRLEQREYETKEGEKRNVVEIVVDDAGPSLRWATAEVARVVRDANATTTTCSTNPNGTQSADRLETCNREDDDCDGACLLYTSPSPRD